MTGPVIDAISQAAKTGTLLVALDFDGTLAPTVDDPAAARALPEAIAAIDALAKTANTAVAIVSGRSMEALKEVLDVPANVILIGSHGAQSLVGGKEVGPVLTVKEHELLEAVFYVVEAVAAQFPGVHLERKPSGCALHTRLASAADAEAARRDVLAAIEGLNNSDRITKRLGKDILEFLIRPADKGEALRWLRELSAATAVVFFGDDVTDEDGFRALTDGDVGVKVGEGVTAAEFRVSSPNDAARMILALSEQRRATQNDTNTSRTP